MSNFLAALLVLVLLCHCQFKVKWKQDNGAVHVLTINPDQKDKP